MTRREVSGYLEKCRFVPVFQRQWHIQQAIILPGRMITSQKHSLHKTEPKDLAVFEKQPIPGEECLSHPVSWQRTCTLTHCLNRIVTALRSDSLYGNGNGLQ